MAEDKEFLQYQKSVVDLPCEQLVSSDAKRESNHWGQPSTFPSSMREFVRPHVIHLMSISLVNFVWNIAGFRCQASVRISRVY